MSVFQQNCKPLAKALVGKKLKFGDHEAEILEAQGYPRKDNETGIYTPILEMRPGAVFFPRHRGVLLFLIACPEGNAPGGCVLIRKVRIGDTVHSGPGKVAQALGVEEAGSQGRLIEAKETLNLHIR